MWLVILGIPVVALLIAWAAGAFKSDGTPAKTTAPPPVPTTKLSIPEGLRRDDIAARMRAAGISPAAYMRATGPSRLGAGLAGRSAPTSLEGFLFPATYDVPKGSTAAKVVDQQLSAFRAYTSGIGYAFARSKNLTRYDVLIIASMIEREVRVPAERRLVASVIYNRLHARMPLQIDATVLYALGSWTADLSRHTPLSSVASPYNTYRHPGLPPGPISNPGVASIKAAAHPARTRYLYYVTRNDGSGRHYFASTLAEFERAVQRSGGG
jgi:UPF0755 protein